MFTDFSYKVSFIFALILHAILITFLLVKFTQAKPIGFGGASVIHATAINLNNKQLESKQLTALQQELPATVNNFQVLPAKKKDVPVLKKTELVKTPKNKLSSVLKKDFLRSQSQELAQLKRERHKYVKNITEQKEQQLLQQSLMGLANNQDVQGTLEQGGQMSGEFDRYKSALVQAISSNWYPPLGLNAGDFCKLEVDVAPGGVVLEVKLVAGTDSTVLARSAQAAILKTSPLPGAEDQQFFNEMRKLRLRFGAEGISVVN